MPNPIRNPLVGVLGAGQLGRMLALAGYPLGMRFRFFDPTPGSPAGQMAEQIVAPYDDYKALERRGIPRRQLLVDGPAPELPLVQPCLLKSPRLSRLNRAARENETPGAMHRAFTEVFSESLLGLPDVRRLRAFRSLRHFVLDLLTLGEAAEPLHLDCGVMDEHVLASAIRCDEAVALRVVEPLHSACRHPSSLSESGPRPGDRAQLVMPRQQTRRDIGSIGTGARRDQGGLRGPAGSQGRCYCPFRTAAAETCSPVGKSRAQAPAG